MLIEIMESFLRIGLGAYGGGWAVIRLIHHELVELRGWLGAKEMAEVVALAQMTPGPIAINAATYTGFRLYGLPGAVLATLSVLLPSLLFLLALYTLGRFPRVNAWIKGLGKLLQPGVWALMAAAVVTLGRAAVESWPLALFAAASFLLNLFLPEKIHPAALILLFGFLSWAVL